MVKPVRSGEAFTHENLRIIRPGYGLPPKEIDAIVAGGVAVCDLEPGTALKPEHIRFWKQ